MGLRFCIKHVVISSSEVNMSDGNFYANSKFIRTNAVCNGTSICGCSQCGGSLDSYRKLANEYPDIVIRRYVGDQYIVDQEMTNWVRSLRTQ